VNKQSTQIKNILESLYARYNHRKFIPPDPLQFVYRYSNQADMEIVAFLASALAYGRVRQIEKSLSEIFEYMGDSPREFVNGFAAKHRRQLQGFKHRFTTGEDIADLLTLLRKVLEKHGSIENFFLLGYSQADENIIPALSVFCNSLTDMYAAKHDGHAGRGLSYLLADPARGSACKRLNLFLRWMVRHDDVDTGLWRSIDKAKLLVPMDVHMARLSGILGFHTRKTSSLAAAVEITKAFAQIAPADPVKFDFALTRIGILENCTGKLQKHCADCQLYDFCRELKGK
jgi:uncharacterized protein (TIGR02757 family)